MLPSVVSIMCIGVLVYLGAGKTVLLDHCLPQTLGDFVLPIMSQLRYVSILKVYHLTVPKAVHPYTPSLSLSLHPFSLPFLPPLLYPFLFLLPSLSLCLSLFLLRSHFLLFSSSLQHCSAHWNVKYEGASTLFCGQMGTERERTLQMKSSKFALKVRGEEEREGSSFVVYNDLSTRQ